MRIYAYGIVLSMLVAASANVNAGQLAVGGQISRELRFVNPNTGRWIRAHDYSFDWQFQWGFNGLAFNTRDQRLYATDADFSTLPPGTPNPAHPRYIYRINPTDYSMEKFLIGGFAPASSIDVLDGLEYDSLRNVFWATNPFGQQLLRIDAQTFQATIIGQFPRTALISGLAYDRATDTLFGVEDRANGIEGSGARSQLVTINTSTLAISSVGPVGLGLNLSDLDSLAFDPVARALYSINDQTAPNQQLVRIDPATGLATAIGPPAFGVEFYQGLAYIVPEPASYVLWACVGAAVVFGRWRASSIVRD